jgi:hypothetical protein
MVRMAIRLPEGAAEVGLVENFGSRAVPIDLATRFFDAVAVAVVGVAHASGGLDFAFRVVAVRVDVIREHVSGGVIGKARRGKLIVGRHGNAQIVLHAGIVS